MTHKNATGDTQRLPKPFRETVTREGCRVRVYDAVEADALGNNPQRVRYIELSCEPEQIRQAP